MNSALRAELYRMPVMIDPLYSTELKSSMSTLPDLSLSIEQIGDSLLDANSWPQIESSMAECVHGCDGASGDPESIRRHRKLAEAGELAKTQACKRAVKKFGIGGSW